MSLLSDSELLRRPTQPPDMPRLRQLAGGKRILITGAGGSIGARFATLAATLAPQALCLLDNSEFGLYSAGRALDEQGAAVERRDILCDIRDQRLLARAFEAFRPDIVVHAAAYKHVPIVEANILEGVRVNVSGTQAIAAASRACGAAMMIFISTDKAVQPASMMGATKRLAERYLQACDLDGAATHFVPVRLGNVIGSQGSAIPLFEEQLRRGKTVTLTDTAMARYFMTAAEAAETALLAGSIAAAGGETARGALYVPAFLRETRMLDLVRDLVAAAHPGDDPADWIAISGVRRGEKLTEQLFAPDEQRHHTASPALIRLQPSGPAPRSAMEALLEDIARAADGFDEPRLIELLRHGLAAPLPDGIEPGQS